MFTTQIKEAFEVVASKHKIETAALMAVAWVESAGVSFWKVNGKEVPAIRFEGHYFHRRLEGAQLTIAIKEGLADPKAGKIKNPNSYAKRYDMLERAKVININVALESTSFGMGQVMGANWRDLNYITVQHLADKAMIMEGQIELMVQFIIANKLLDELSDHRWDDFARVYNGSNYKKNSYAKNMAKAYANLTGKMSSEKAHIKELQEDLNTLGYNSGKADGIMGRKTKSAIYNFQMNNDLVADSVAGPITLDEIEIQIAKKGENHG